ncbi:adenylate cyclase [Apiospora arundinis]|uniref:Adenylate cyclase n=1 Tax=Apiospora arundinis TaxID=335852 RepID=A0ABR2ISR9_9PEZI
MRHRAWQPRPEASPRKPNQDREKEEEEDQRIQEVNIDKNINKLHDHIADLEKPDVSGVFGRPDGDEGNLGFCGPFPGEHEVAIPLIEAQLERPTFRKASLRLEMLCSTLEEVSGGGGGWLQPPETELLERMKQVSVLTINQMAGIHTLINIAPLGWVS